MHRYFLLIALLGVAAGLRAQTRVDSLSGQQINTVVVTAQFVPTNIRQTVNTVRVLDQKTIERRAAVNLEELLQTDPNIRFAQDAILGSAVSINGLRGENVKILVDGVPVVGRQDGSLNAGQLPLGAVQQVEIIEGAQSLLYGSEASAGVVNLVTRKSQLHRFEATASPQWESNGFRNLQGRAGVRMGKFLMQLTGNQLGFQPQPDASVGRAQFWNPKTQAAGRASLRFSPSEKFDLRLSGGRFSEKVDNFGEIRRPQFKPYAFDDYYHTNRTDAMLHGEGWLPNRWFWQATTGWNRFDRIKNSYRFNLEDESKILLEDQQDTSAVTGWLNRVTFARDRRDRRCNVLFGIENYTESAEGVRIVDSTASRPGLASGNDLGIFSSAKAHFFDQKLTLQGGARWTFNRLFGSALTPSVWLLFQPNTRWQARLSYANGFRSPGLKELYFSFIDINHYVTGNTGLSPERSHNLRGELSWRQSARQQSSMGFTISGFYNTVANRIVLAEFTPVQYRYANLRRWETMGSGLSFVWSTGEWLRFRSDIIMTGFFNTYREEKTELRRFNWSPDWVNDLTLSFFQQRANLTLWHKMTGKTPYFFERNNTIEQGETEGWHLLNAALGCHLFKQNIRVNMGVKNILDTRQIRAGSDNRDPGHSSADIRPVHWGRTFFVATTFNLHSTK